MRRRNALSFAQKILPDYYHILLYTWHYAGLHVWSKNTTQSPSHQDAHLNLVFFKTFIDFTGKCWRKRGREGRRGRGERRERNVDARETWISFLPLVPRLGIKPAPRHMPWLRTPQAFGVRDAAPTNWATPARACIYYF